VVDARPLISYISVMQASQRSRLLAFFTVLLAAASFLGDHARAQDFSIGTMQIGKPWTRATPKGATVAGGYMTISNKGTAPDRLLGGSAAVADRFEVVDREDGTFVELSKELPARDGVGD